MAQRVDSFMEDERVHRQNMADAINNLGAGPAVIKAWALVTTTAGTPVITTSYNVASVADNGVGDYTFTFDTPFANNNYTVTGSVAGEDGGTTSYQIFVLEAGRLAASSRVILENADGVNVDAATGGGSIVYIGNQ